MRLCDVFSWSSANKMTILPGSMTGTYYVRAVRPAFQDAKKCLPKMSDRAELRRQVLKLRFWGADGGIQEDGIVVDLNWSWVRARRDLRIGELRIDDTIGGNNNLRVITWHHMAPARLDGTKLGPIIWECTSHLGSFCFPKEAR